MRQCFALSRLGGFRGVRAPVGTERGESSGDLVASEKVPRKSLVDKWENMGNSIVNGKFSWVNGQ